MSIYLIRPPKCGGKYGTNAIISFLGATSIQPTEPKWWVLKHSYPLINAAKLSKGTEKYFKKALYESNVHSTIIVGVCVFLTSL